MSEKDFTPEERRELRAMMQQFKAGNTVQVAPQAPQGSSYLGKAGRFAVYIYCGVLTVVALLNFQDDVKQAWGNGVSYTEVVLNTLEATMPTPAPRRDPSDYPRETALASNTAHPDHTIIRLSTVESTTTPPV